MFCYQLPEAAIENLFHCQPQVKGLNISNTRADEAVLTLSSKGLNSLHGLQSEGRIFCRNKNPDVAIQAATQLFCFCVVCLVCQQTKAWLCKTVASDLCGERGIDPANDLGPMET